MSNGEKNVILINGSPKPNEVSVSEALASILERRLNSDGMSVSNINVRKNIVKDNSRDFLDMINADALVFIFPLYFFCLPGVLIRYLQDFYGFYQQRGRERTGETSVYAVVNCGFPESNINEEALRVIKSFSGHIGASYRFGVSLGGGGMFLGAKDAPFMKKPVQALDSAFDSIAADIAGDKQPERNAYIEIKFPRALYFLGGNMGWKQLARKNGLKKKDLYARPYNV